MNLHGPDHSCLLLKAGMDAQKAGVMDLIWHSPEDKQPQIDFYDLIPLYQFAKSKAVSRSVDKHMRKLWKMEQGKALVHLTVFKEESIMSSKNIRRQQTTLGSFLCSALRDELEADCVVFDGGNIRGRSGLRAAGGAPLGQALGLHPLRSGAGELPWSSDMVVIVLSGGQLAEAIKVSRTEKRGTGGFFQMDTGVRWEAEEVTHIANEPLDKARMYCVGLMHASLAGMNDNHVFKEWRQDHIMPKERMQANLPKNS
ncbi:unnamed protein product [Effrenium voratum]|uniref:5'-Nucleotidase C-terminal domain-containing protein n=1 Tax=Effrenium voratum TaxID=2562239 RepID=A0AA36JD18_9DINO|nr:unnamed protein product [Effrenium voratum]